MDAERIDPSAEPVQHTPVIYLLDTSALLWFIMEPNRLSEAAKAIWLDPQKLVAVSVVSYWETAIKANRKIFEIDEAALRWDQRMLPYIDLETIPIRDQDVSERCRCP